MSEETESMGTIRVDRLARVAWVAWCCGTHVHDSEWDDWDVLVAWRALAERDREAWRLVAAAVDRASGIRQ